MKTIRRLFVFLLVLSFMLSTGISALAFDWYLADGDISIYYENSTQIVSQNATTTPDSNPHIYGTDTNNNVVETANTISVSSGTGETVQFTVDSLDIDTTRDKNAINIKDGSTAVMTVVGTNTLDNTATGSGDTHATIRVGDGSSLTIQGSGDGSELLVNCTDLDYSTTGYGAAGIGSDKGKDFNGELTITGDINVQSEASDNGAAIGSGYNGNFAGTLNITNGANVHTEACNNGASIGSGYNGDFTGTLNISNSTVYSDVYANGAAIGAGRAGDFTGEMNISHSDVTAISGHSGNGEGAGIGAGYNGNFGGKLNITDSTVYAKATNDGAGIGAGGTDSTSPSPTEFTAQAQLNIHNSKVTADTRSQGIPIGAPESLDVGSKYDGVFNGTINITGDSELTLIDGRNTELGKQALIGGADASSSGKVNMEDSVKITYWAGTCPDKGELGEGSYTVASPEDYKEFIKGAEITITKAPKTDANDPATTDAFWHNIYMQIVASEKGDKLIVNAGQRTSLPVFILDALEAYEVELTIHWNGGKEIVVPCDHGIEYAGSSIPFSELVELLAK